MAPATGRPLRGSPSVVPSNRRPQCPQRWPASVGTTLSSIADTATESDWCACGNSFHSSCRLGGPVCPDRVVTVSIPASRSGPPRCQHHSTLPSDSRHPADRRVLHGFERRRAACGLSLARLVHGVGDRVVDGHRVDALRERPVHDCRERKREYIGRLKALQLDLDGRIGHVAQPTRAGNDFGRNLVECHLRLPFWFVQLHGSSCRIHYADAAMPSLWGVGYIPLRDASGSPMPQVHRGGNERKIDRVFRWGGEMSFCPNCSREIAANAIKCEHCGATFGEGSQWQPLSAPP